MSNYKKEYELWDEFLKVWPLARLTTMKLDDYTQVGSKDSFTRWIEARLDELGSIWGGSSFKFGVFSRKDTDTCQAGEQSIEARNEGITVPHTRNRGEGGWNEQE